MAEKEKQHNNNKTHIHISFSWGIRKALDGFMRTVAPFRVPPQVLRKHMLKCLKTPCFCAAGSPGAGQAQRNTTPAGMGWGYIRPCGDGSAGGKPLLRDQDGRKGRKRSGWPIWVPWTHLPQHHPPSHGSRAPPTSTFPVPNWLNKPSPPQARSNEIDIIYAVSSVALLMGRL